MKLARTIAAGALALGIAAVPGVAHAAPDQQGPADRAECWIRQLGPLSPASHSISRLRADGVTEVLVGSGRRELLGGPNPLCTEILAGVLVHTPEAPAALAYLVDYDRHVRGVVVLGGQEVPAALDLYELGQLANCESHMRWDTDTGNGYYGAFQILPSTWAANDGLRHAARPDYATAAEQVEVTRNILRSQGWGAYPGCARALGYGP